ncbi:MAG: hypothetical protein CMN32_04655 [Saprospirales bacterium]|nr:hypothetical protein [Saprospirales bacterium]
MVKQANSQMTAQLSGKALLGWRILQWLFLAIGLTILSLLFFAPQIGIHAFWNGLIPVAPLLLVLLPGLWRNVCPLAFSAILPHRIGLSAKKRLTVARQGKLILTGVILLMLILPWRHLVLDNNGPATGVVLILLGAMAFYMGTQYEWKSGWCSGMCPVHPVEKFYGSRPLAPMPNAQCTSCHNCVIPCPDSTKLLQPEKQDNTRNHKLAATLLIGGFPGYIWGWFHIRDYHGTEGLEHILAAYTLPLAGMAFTLAVYLFLRKNSGIEKSLLTRIFAAAAVTCYYWYRLPALIGFGIYPGDGMLVDLSGQVPNYLPFILQGAALLFFSWWLLWKPTPQTSWTIRPPFANRRKRL